MEGNFYVHNSSNINVFRSAAKHRIPKIFNPRYIISYSYTFMLHIPRIINFYMFRSIITCLNINPILKWLYIRFKGRYHFTPTYINKFTFSAFIFYDIMWNVIRKLYKYLFFICGWIMVNNVCVWRRGDAFMAEGYLILFFSLFSITAICIVALSDKKSDIKIENKITLRPDEISSDTKVNINNSKKNNR